MKNRRQPGKTRSSSLVIAALAVITLLGAALLVNYFRAPSPKVSNSLLPELSRKPQPLLRSFNGCPPEGDGGDPDLNRLKNRIDDAQFVPVPFEAVEKLDWPRTIERRRRVDWNSRDASAIAHYEGLPLSVEGYLAGSRLEGPESPNCHGAGGDFRDFHIWLTKSVGEDRSTAIVVEMTPAVRAQHSNWTIVTLGNIAREKDKVRVSGWLLLDPDHPDQVGKTRGTIWEIHPIIKFEVEQKGSWIALDDFER